MNITKITNRFRDLKILVIGDSILDVYYEGIINGLCREAPAPVVLITKIEYLAGGAGNAAVNIKRLGAGLNFLSVIGKDKESMSFKKCLAENRISAKNIIDVPGRKTIVKSRVSKNAQMLLRFDSGDTQIIDRETEQKFKVMLGSFLPQSDALLISDYNYGAITPGIIEEIGILLRKFPCFVIVDSKKPQLYKNIPVNVVKPNYYETIKFLNIKEVSGIDARVEQICSYEKDILEMTGADIVAVTLDAEGALIFEKKKPAYRTYAGKTGMRSITAGTGDVFTSAFSLALVSGAETTEAAEIASMAASIAVSKTGTAVCSLEELLEHFSRENKFIDNIESLISLKAYYNQKRKVIVFTNGCFDILHRGHITYLNRAKALGDILIVGVNSDSSVRRLKGEERPINALEDRIQILAAMSCVDHVISFDDDSPRKIIEILRPHVYVKGGDYTRETLPETELVESLGGKIYFLPYVEDNSTSEIIKRIREKYNYSDRKMASV